MTHVIFEPERGQRVPIRVWARAISDETLQQLRRLASAEYVVGFVAAMADAHVSSGVAVGSVFATERAVVPGALGGDLGCGMRAIKIASEIPARSVLERIVTDLGKAIPTGHATHRGRGVSVPDALFESSLATRALDRAREALARRHLGTLGGGNHFLELDRDAEGALYLLIHTGSRGLGKNIYMHHARVSSERGPLAALDIESEEGAAYFSDVTWSLAFAREIGAS